MNYDTESPEHSKLCADIHHHGRIVGHGALSHCLCRGELSARKIAGQPEYPAFSANPTLDHFDNLFSRTNYILWYRNTFTIAVANTMVVLAVTLISAYIFSRFRFKLKKPMLMSFLVLQMFPSVVGVIAIYVILNRLALSDSYLGLILVYSAGALPYNIWLIKGILTPFPNR